MINEEDKPCPLLSTLTCTSTITHSTLSHFPTIILHLHFYSYHHHTFNDVYHGFSWWSLFYVSIELLLELRKASAVVFTIHL